MKNETPMPRIEEFRERAVSAGIIYDGSTPSMTSPGASHIGAGTTPAAQSTYLTNDNAVSPLVHLVSTLLAEVVPSSEYDLNKETALVALSVDHTSSAASSTYLREWDDDMQINQYFPKLTVLEHQTINTTSTISHHGFPSTSIFHFVRNEDSAGSGN
jgi:hypothetical protein